jgi:hypothetical protein
MEGVVRTNGLSEHDPQSRDEPRGPRIVVGGTAGQLDAVLALDRQITGTDRRRLLIRLFEERPEAWRVSVVGDGVLGYSTWRPGSRAVQMGPAVAMDSRVGSALADTALAACQGQPIFVDIPIDNAGAMAWADSHTLRVQRRFTRMRRGRPVDDQPQRIWASSGAEKG